MPNSLIRFDRRISFCNNAVEEKGVDTHTTTAAAQARWDLTTLRVKLLRIIGREMMSG